MTGTILDKIIAAKRMRIEATKRNARLDIEHRTANAFRFSESIKKKRPAIIAEFKRASPSKGVINYQIDPAVTAAKYSAGGAAAISVLTEEDFFLGSLDDLRIVRAAVDIPILRKDFVIDEFQVRESAAAGADAILLIVAALSIADLRVFHALAHEHGLDALVEVHNPAEMETAAAIGAKLIGVNNRDLKTFDVSLDVSRELIALAPADALLISESGISARAEIEELTSLGYSGFLVGESLMKADDAAGTLEAWL